MANIVKTYAGASRLRPQHLLRSLAALRLPDISGCKGAIFKMMDVSRHKSVDTLRKQVFPLFLPDTDNHGDKAGQQSH